MAADDPQLTCQEAYLQRIAQKTADAKRHRELGEALASNYLFPFELAALILLMALVGAASIARSRKSDEPQTDDQEA